MMQFKNKEQIERYIFLQKEIKRVKGEMKLLSYDVSREKYDALVKEFSDLRAEIEQIQKDASVRAYESEKNVRDYVDRLKAPIEDIEAFNKETKEFLININKYNQSYIDYLKKTIEYVKKSKLNKEQKKNFKNIEKEIQQLISEREKYIQDNTECLNSL